MPAKGGVEAVLLAWVSRTSENKCHNHEGSRKDQEFRKRLSTPTKLLNFEKGQYRDTFSNNRQDRRFLGACRSWNDPLYRSVWFSSSAATFRAYGRTRILPGYSSPVFSSHQLLGNACRVSRWRDHEHLPLRRSSGSLRLDLCPGNNPRSSAGGADCL